MVERGRPSNLCANGLYPLGSLAHDWDLKPGQSAYYYVRALIGEDDVAWSSPIWVTRDQ